jgi:hypothetical protein
MFSPTFVLLFSQFCPLWGLLVSATRLLRENITQNHFFYILNDTIQLPGLLDSQKPTSSHNGGPVSCSVGFGRFPLSRYYPPRRVRA